MFHYKINKIILYIVLLVTSNHIFKTNAVLLNFVLIKESWKKYHVFHTNIKQINYLQHW